MGLENKKRKATWDRERGPQRSTGGYSRWSPWSQELSTRAVCIVDGSAPVALSGLLMLVAAELCGIHHSTAAVLMDAVNVLTPSCAVQPLLGRRRRSVVSCPRISSALPPVPLRCHIHHCPQNNGSYSVRAELDMDSMDAWIGRDDRVIP